MPDDPRHDLAAAQARLVAALAGELPAPSGFDVSRVSLAAEMLRVKRYHGALHCFPAAQRWLGANAAGLFAEYARIANHPPVTGSVVDGMNFLRSLARDRTIPDPVRVELLYAKLRVRPWAVVVVSGPPRRLLIVLRLGALPLLRLSIPWPFTAGSRTPSCAARKFSAPADRPAAAASR